MEVDTFHTIVLTCTAKQMGSSLVHEASTLLRRSKIGVYHFFLFSGNGLLAGLSMKRPSVYIDQWTEENAQWHLLENINIYPMLKHLSRRV